MSAKFSPDTYVAIIMALDTRITHAEEAATYCEVLNHSPKYWLSQALAAREAKAEFIKRADRE